MQVRNRLNLPARLLLSLLVAVALNAAPAICPTTIENDPSVTDDACGVLLNVSQALSVSAVVTGTMTYNGSDSTFGIVNSSSETVLSLLLTGGDITLFTSNGITTYVSANGVPIPPTPPIVFGYESYYGPAITFSDVDYAGSSLRVNFIGGLASGASTYFSLPGTPEDNVAGLTGPGGVMSVQTLAAVPEPTTWGLSLIGLMLAGSVRRALGRRVS